MRNQLTRRGGGREAVVITRASAAGGRRGGRRSRIAHRTRLGQGRPPAGGAGGGRARGRKTNLEALAVSFSEQPLGRRTIPATPARLSRRRSLRLSPTFSLFSFSRCPDLEAATGTGGHTRRSHCRTRGRAALHDSTSAMLRGLLHGKSRAPRNYNLTTWRAHCVSGLPFFDSLSPSLFTGARCPRSRTSLAQASPDVSGL